MEKRRENVLYTWQKQVWMLNIWEGRVSEVAGPLRGLLLAACPPVCPNHGALI